MEHIYVTQQTKSPLIETSLGHSGLFSSPKTGRNLEKFYASDLKSCFRCFLCGQIYFNKQALYQHELERHRIYRCSFGDCQQSFPHVKALALHEETYHKPLQCSACGTYVEGSAMITKHLSEQHNQPVPFVCACKECNLFFPTPRDKAQHLHRAHVACRTGTAFKNVMRRAERIGSQVNQRSGERLPVYLPVIHHEYLQRFVEELISTTEEDEPHTPENPNFRKLSERNLYQFDHVD